MRYINVGGSGLMASAIALGCMRIGDLDPFQAAALIGAAKDAGINLFDHADIYSGGRSEEIFARALGMKPSTRQEILIQSKCGVCDDYYDSSAEHIISSVEGSLKRLRTDYLDVFLLHRPDTLSQPAEVAAAFDALSASGKVRHFGVSNHSPGQLELLRKEVTQPLIVNQLQLSIAHTTLIDSGLNVNIANSSSTDRDGGALDYCRLHGVTIQAWSPLQYGTLAGSLLDTTVFPELNRQLQHIACDTHVSPAALAIAWILRHPANIQAIVGSTTPSRIEEIAKASDVPLTSQQWYAIYRAAGNILP